MLRKKTIKDYFLKKGNNHHTKRIQIKKIDISNNQLNILATDIHKNWVYHEITEELSDIKEIHKIACKLSQKWEIIVLNQ